MHWRHGRLETEKKQTELDHFFRRNCLQKLPVEGKTDGRRGRRKGRSDVLANLMWKERHRIIEQLGKCSSGENGLRAVDPPLMMMKHV